MTRIKTMLLTGVALAGLTVSSFASAGQIFNWGVDLSGLGGPTITNVNNLSFNGESYVDNTFSSGTSSYTFTNDAVFNITQKNGGLGLGLGNGQLTAVFSGATGSGNTSSGTFSFAPGGTLTFYYNDSQTYGTEATSNYGASEGTAIGTFTLLSGGGAVNPDGTPSSNGNITANLKATSLSNRFVTSGGNPLMDTYSLILGYSTINASQDNAFNSSTNAIPDLASALSGAPNTLNAAPDHFFVNDGGQFKLTQVPEPSALALLGLGILGIAVMARRGSKKA